MPTNLVIFPRKHTPYKCPGGHWGEPCMYCDGGLFHCTVCGGAEGSLTEHCCGRRMTNEEEAAVYAGTLDFRASQGGWTEWTRDRRNAVKASLEDHQWRG